MKIYAGVAALLLTGCNQPVTTAALPASFTLKCSGTEQIAIQREGVDQPVMQGNNAVSFYRWNDETKTLVTEASAVEPTAFCRDQGQEECSVSTANGRLVASNFDMSPGKAPNSVVSFGEKIDIDLGTMTGKASITNSTGTLTDDAARIHMKTVVTRPLRCERA